MALTPNDPIVKKADTKSLKQAQFEDTRHRIHAESATSVETVSPYYKTWVRDFIEPTIKAQSTRDQLIRQLGFPLPAVELVDEIIDSTLSVHYAQDRSITIEMADDKLQADAEAYLERIDLAGFIIRSCHNALFSAPNSLVVIDAPSNQTTDYPEPYCYLLNSDKVQKVKAKTGSTADSGLLEFSFFETDKPGIFALFDQQDISTWIKGEGGTYKELSRVAHNLKFSPAFKMWADIEENSPIVSNSVTRPMLRKLDDYNFWYGAQNVNDLGAAFNILWHLETDSKCDYRTGEGHQCQKGIIEIPKTDGTGFERTPCPVRNQCAAKKVGGIGSRLPIPAPQTKDEPDWRVPAGWISAEVTNLEYIQTKVERMAIRILQTATGNSAGPQNEQALNESQILAILEASRRVGQYLAQHFETLHKRLIDGLLGYRYGQLYIGCNASYGRRFVVLTGDQLQVLYESAKKIGEPWLMEEIDGMLQDYYARSDASRSLRLKILSDLNPYKGMSPADMASAGIKEIDPEGFILSIGLRHWVRQFEIEHNVPVERFGILTEYPNRVKTIYETLKDYVTKANFQFSNTTSGQGDPNNPNPDGSSNGNGGGKNGGTGSKDRNKPANAN